MRELRCYYGTPPFSAKKGDSYLRSYTQLSQDERYHITELRISRRSKAEIARALTRSPSTISRELERNKKLIDGKYRADLAHSYATTRRKRERRGFHLAPHLWEDVITLLKQDWSPEQISNYLRMHGSFTLSHETIYQYIYEDERRGGTLVQHLRIVTKTHRKRYKSRDSRGILPGKRHISQRPPEVETRLQLGHWEGDTVIGSDRHHCILTLVERRSGFAIIKKLESRTAASVTQAAMHAISEHQTRFRTITFDNGTEFHGYEELEQHFPLKCYFATPYHSWERGSNENLNGLIRQYIPKKACMSAVTQSYCDAMAYRLNSRPRKRHGYISPHEVYYGSSRLLHFNFELRRIHYWTNSLMNSSVCAGFSINGL
jgi:transposase, IS30 family